MHLTKIVLAGFGVVALALSATTTGGRQVFSTETPASLWLDAQTQKYHCAGRDIILCETTTGGSCVAVDFCEAYCLKHNKGAACLDMGKTLEDSSSIMHTPTPKETVPAFAMDIAARDASPQENKHYICSKNRRSVLICRYGFCSTDHYCKPNEECKDGPPACKNKSLSAQASKSEIREVAHRGEAVPRKLVTRNRGKDRSTFVCSKDRVSVLKCTYGFCATDYYCAKGHPCVDNPVRCKKAS